MAHKTNKVKLAQSQGQIAFGAWIRISSPDVVEAAGYQGYDFVVIDLEHGGFGLDTVPSMVRAAEAADVAPVVRVPGIEESTILKVLDAGAMGVLVPGISTKEQAERAVRASKYAPLGNRGACPWIRATGYKIQDWTAHVKWSNEETMV
jgi:4-hydroxy-2-oxoheptanedioate aldolase